jgi:E3 SUMO-protein ligase PIAS1
MLTTSSSVYGAYQFQAVSNALPYGTAVDLKQIILAINTRCGTNMIRSGRKQDLVDRLRGQFATWKNTNNVATWKTAMAIIDGIRLPVASFVSLLFNTRYSTLSE